MFKWHTILTVSILVFQVKSGYSLSPQLEQCKEKFKEQAKQIDFSHLPSCFDSSKLAEAKDHVKIFEKLFNEIPPECKHPSRDNIKSCFSKSIQLLKDNSEDVQASIVGSFNALYKGSKECIDMTVSQFTNLDEYIANGCQDPQ
ncbi:uncharacterized protein LOC126742513 [Anthonomus grandis grandis]|uniref:uncharacterized protein LOC126742513 n=1 Tax=Anthonomus grandis grandis TaxID=2921223 RepID=UPI002165C6E4|nr:uncharacterized protein LOC126742513 [Anthonomus grandis grandis]